MMLAANEDSKSQHPRLDGGEVHPRRPVIESALIQRALQDLWEGWRRRELWLMLGWRDVLSRYRRSMLGPLWISISTGIFAACMGALYSAILQISPVDYIPYLVTGFIAWNLLSGLLLEGLSSFVGNSAAIREMPVPTTIYVYRLLWRNVLILAHNIVVYAIVIAVFKLSPFPAIILVVPALALILVNGMWIGLLLGLINARYRDFGQVVPNAIRLIFFVTPIIWYADSVSGLRSVFVYFNPFFYFIEIFRAPLLGEVPGWHVWAVTLAITLIGWAIALPVYARWRDRIIYWV
jgi:ABC-type polysaccharide/polyol phosphate export permease